MFDALRDRGKDVDDLIHEKQELGGKNEDGSYRLTYEAASREVVAEALTDILPDSHFVERLAEKHKNVFELLIDKLKEFIASVREYFEDIKSNADPAANALMDEVDGSIRYMESIVALFDKVAVNAVENYQASVAVDESVDVGKDDANARKTHEKYTESHENASMQTADTTLDKRAISYFKSRANVYVIEFDGQKYLSDSAVMIQVTDTDIQYANEEFDVAENSLPDSNKAILNSAGTLLVAPPTEVRIATNKTFYRFDVGDQKLYFNKKLLSLLDGGLLYYGIIGENTGVIKSVNTDGSVKGYLLGMKMPKVLQSTEEAPAKLRSFSKKMQALIQSKSATDNNDSNITQAQPRSQHDDDYYTRGVHWGVEAGIMTKAEARTVWNAIANIEKLNHHYPQTINGEHIISADNAMFFLNTDYHYPVVNKIIRFDETYEINNEYAKELIIDAKGNPTWHGEALRFIEIMYGQGYVNEYDGKDGVADGGQVRIGKGTDRSADTGEDADRISRQLAPILMK